MEQVFFDDLEQMAKSKDIDAVYIASPNALHSRQAITCLKHKNMCFVKSR